MASAPTGGAAVGDVVGEELSAAAGVLAIDLSPDGMDGEEASDAMDTSVGAGPASDVSEADKQNLNVERQEQTVRSWEV